VQVSLGLVGDVATRRVGRVQPDDSLGEGQKARLPNCLTLLGLVADRLAGVVSDDLLPGLEALARQPDRCCHPPGRASSQHPQISILRAWLGKRRPDTMAAGAPD